MQDGGAVFEIANTGPEVSAERLPQLFEPFTRANERLDFQNGVGLGLSIAQAIAHAHDTSVIARPRPNGGLQVSITLPG
jgi:signal transduction histidine kinase